MLRLEEKLIKLKYESLGCYYSKDISYKAYKFTLVIAINTDEQSIRNYYLYINDRLFSISSKDDLKSFEYELQQAFNQLQNDLEVLKEYENASCKNR